LPVSGVGGDAALIVGGTTGAGGGGGTGNKEAKSNQGSDLSHIFIEFNINYNHFNKKA